METLPSETLTGKSPINNESLIEIYNLILPNVKSICQFLKSLIPDGHNGDVIKSNELINCL